MGISSAAMLARRGWKVDVLERRAEPAEAEDSTARTYPMQINRKARVALEEAAGLYLGEYLEPRANVMGGHLVDWSGLTTQLLSSAAQQHPDSLTFHWSCGLSTSEAIDLDRRRVRVSTGEGERELEYDLLVGADGFNSAVRNKLLGAGFLESQVVLSASGPETSRYKVVHGLDKQEYGKLAAQPSHADAQGTRISMTRQAFGFVRFSFWPRIDGTFSAMVIAKELDFEPESFAAKLHEDAAALPQTWRESIIKQCSETEASKFGAIVKNSSFAGPGVVLVGDAAHSVTSTLGQGCCLGLSGMKALAAAVDSATDVANIPLVYNKAWVPNAHALQRMEYQTVLSIRPGVLGAFWKLMGLLSVIGGTLLQYVAPQRVPKPLFFYWLGEPGLSYRQALTTYWGAVALGSGVLVAAAWVLNLVVLNTKAAAKTALFGA